MTNPVVDGLGSAMVRVRRVMPCRAAMVLAACGTMTAWPCAVIHAQTQPPQAGDAAAKQKDAEQAGLVTKEATAPVDDGPSYLVSGFLLGYGPSSPVAELPDLLDKSFRNIRVVLGKTPEGYVKPRAGVERVTIKLSDIAEGSGGKFFRSAIEEVCLAVVEELHVRGIYAPFVAPNSEDIEERAPYADLRDGKTALRLTVFTAIVGVKPENLRTVASGDRELAGEKINNPAHKRILDNSPLQPGGQLRKDKLDDYLFQLNRHPGRRVDAAIAGADAEEPGSAQVDYLVGESKPWTVYFQLSNTGTENTNVWRERFGFVHNQVTNHDDIFRIDYSTAGFESSHALLPSYEFWLSPGKLRGRIFGSWSEFTASDVGINNLEFTGNSWSGGGELIGTVYQRGAMFLDLVGGLRYEHYRVVDPVAGGSPVEGKDNFLLPSLSARLTKYTDASSTLAELGFDFVANEPDQAEVQHMGRGNNVDNQWVLLKWNVDESFFIEPLLIGPRGTPDGKGMTLAHEAAFSFRGQYAFDYRPIPNYQAVAGGLYTVRGYPESVVAGDNLYLGTAEYRFHLPNSMAVKTEPGKFLGNDFRWAPQSPYSRADWDLIFRGFFDAAWVTTNNRDPVNEPNVALLSTGVGAEFQLYRNLNLRLDWGFPLKSVHIPGRDVTAGKSQVHFVMTLAY